MTEDFAQSKFDGPYGKEDAHYDSRQQEPSSGQTDQQGSYDSQQQQQQPSRRQTDQQDSYSSQQQEEPGYADGQTQDNLGSEAGYGQQKAESGYGTGGTEGAFNAPSYGGQDENTGGVNQSPYESKQSEEFGGDSGNTYDQGETGSKFGQSDPDASGEKKEPVDLLEGVLTRKEDEDDVPIFDAAGGGTGQAKKKQGFF